MREHRTPGMSGDQFREWFWSMTERADNGDIVWRGSLDSNGYGEVRVNGRSHRAHRIAFELSNGPIPDGLGVLHRPGCGSRACVNPDHLYAGDQKQNVADMFACGTYPNAKLSNDDVRQIRKLRADGVARIEVARMFGINKHAVSLITTRKTWRHVE